MSDVTGHASDATQDASDMAQHASDMAQDASDVAQDASDMAQRIPDVRALSAGLDHAGYLADEPLATALFLAVRMRQPILLEGEPGVGKTEAAKALAAVIDTPLVRLQCYEGIAAAEALYEWNYPRQLLSIRLAEATGGTLPSRLASPRPSAGRPTSGDRRQ